MKRIMFHSCVIIAAILVVGCSDKPYKGGVTRSQLEAKIGESNNWRDVTLFQSHYIGHAVTANGEKLIIEVEQTSDKISVHWKTASGTDEGSSDIEW